MPKSSKQKSSPKSMRFGNKQNEGESRKRYFALAKSRIAANKARKIAKAQAEKVATINRKFEKGIVRGAVRLERVMLKRLEAAMAHEKRERELAERRNPTAVIANIDHPITPEDIRAASHVLLWRRQEEIRAQERQRAERLEARRQRMNAAIAKR